MTDIKKYLKENGANTLFLSVLPTVCRCGYELNTNQKLTTLYCSNAQCPYHMAAKMEAMFKDLKVKGLGRSLCLDIVQENKLKHHTEVYKLGVQNMPKSCSKAYASKLFKAIQKCMPTTLGEVVRACEFNDLNSRALTLCKGYENASKFYEDYSYNIDFIRNRLGINSDIIPNSIHRTLVENETLIKEVSSWFTLRKEADLTIKVAITGSVKSITRPNGTKFRPREDYLKWLQNEFMHTFTIEQALSITADTTTLLADSPSSHNKYSTAVELGKPIMQYKQLYDLLKYFSQEEIYPVLKEYPYINILIKFMYESNLINKLIELTPDKFMSLSGALKTRRY